jgi:hypothetical protein
VPTTTALFEIEVTAEDMEKVENIKAKKFKQIIID